MRPICYALAAAVIIIIVLLISGLRFKTVESNTGVTYRYFGWIFDDKPALGILHVSDGTTATVKGGDTHYSDGSVYRGELLDFMKHGKGELKYRNGSRYNGEFQNDKPSGYGTFTKRDGSSYEGEYKNGLYHGEGVLKIAGVGTYTGSFEKGMRDGKGSIVYENGDTFVGTYKNDVRSEGVYTWTDGDSIEGKFIGNMPSMTEKLIYTDKNGRTFLVYYDYVAASLNEKQAYLRPAEPEVEAPEEDDDGDNVYG